MTTMRVVGECFFWYWLTRVFPDKFHRAVKRLLCVCQCCCVVVCQLPAEEAADSSCAASQLTCDHSAVTDHVCASSVVNGITHWPCTRHDKGCADELSSPVNRDCIFQSSDHRSDIAGASCALPLSTCQVGFQYCVKSDILITTTTTTFV